MVAQVNRVIRIHNRYLRSRFDQRVQEIIDKGTLQMAKSKGSYEYLFYGEVPLLSQKTKTENEILRIAEVSTEFKNPVSIAIFRRGFVSQKSTRN